MDINTAVYKFPIMSCISNFSSDSDSFAETVWKAPKTVGTITVFTLNCLLTSAPKCMYLLIFSFSFSLTWWSIGIAKSTMYHVFSSLSINLPDNLHIGDTSWPSIWYFIEFTHIDCFCAAHTIASVSFVRCPSFKPLPRSLCAHFLCIFYKSSTEGFLQPLTCLLLF